MKYPASHDARRAMLRSAAATHLLLALAVSGCAATRPAVADAEDATHIRVQNNVMPPTQLTVSLIPVTGSRQMVGFVGSSETKTLELPSDPPAGPVRLLAETTDGSALASRQFTILDGETVVWDVSANMVSVLATP